MPPTMGGQKKEELWHFSKEAADSVDGHERCLRRPAQSVRRSARFLLNRVGTVPSIAGSVSQNGRIAAAKLLVFLLDHRL